MRMRLMLAVTVCAAALLLTGCVGSPHEYDRVNAVAKELDLNRLPGLLASDHFGHAPRIEGDPPSYSFVYRSSASLEASLENRVRGDDFAASGKTSDETLWLKNEGSTVHLQVRIDTLKPNTSYTRPNKKILSVPSSGAVLVTVSSL